MATSLVVHLDILPDKFDAFLALARAHADRSRQREEGCLDFQVHLPREVPNQVILVEIYRDDAAVDRHLNSSHMVQYLEETGTMVAKRRRVVCDH
jgi:quinol monooxygenase YgiN